MELNKAQLRLAIEWTCPDCQRTNFISAIEQEITEEEPAEDGSQEGMAMMCIPEKVCCQFCKNSFETLEPDGWHQGEPYYADDES